MEVVEGVQSPLRTSSLDGKKALVIHKFLRDFGGVEVVVRQTIDWLVRSGVRVTAAGLDSSENWPSLSVRHVTLEDPSSDRGIRGSARYVRSALLGSEFRRIVRDLVRDDRPDFAVVFHAYHQLGTTFFHELGRARVPTVLSVHDYKLVCPAFNYFSGGRSCSICLEASSAGRLLNVARKSCWSGGGRIANVVVGLSNTTADLRGDYLKNVDAVVVLNERQFDAAVATGFAPDQISLVRNSAPWQRPELPDAPRRGRVAFVGRLIPEKGCDVLIRSLAGCNLSLTVAGDGPEIDTLTRLGRQLGVPVRFLGAVSAPEVRDLMCASDVLVVPSLCHDVFPLVICEAFGLGIPVIGSEIGGIPDLLRDGRGILFEPGNADQLRERILHLVDDPGERTREMREAARRFASTKLSASAWEEGMESAIRHAADRAGAPFT